MIDTTAHFRRILAVLCLAVSILISSCARDVTLPADTAVPPDLSADSPDDALDGKTVIDRTAHYDTAVQSYLSSIPSEDYAGSSFFITAPFSDVITPNETNTVYSAAKYKRNRLVEEQWNISLSTAEVDIAYYATLVRAAVQADEFYADLLMLPQYLIGTMVTDDSLASLNSLPFLQLDQPYFDSASKEATTIGSKTYAIAGPASFEASTLTPMFFNRGLLEANNLTLPFETVERGMWTWDVFFTLADCVSAINKESGTSYASHATQYTDILPATIFFSAGSRFISSDGSFAPAIAYSETDADAAALLKKIYSLSTAHKDTESGLSKFNRGESLFLLDRLYLMTWMPNGAVNWGILPMPKANAAQENYISLVSRDALFFAAQKNTSDASRTAVILSALNGASYGKISDAYIEYCMQYFLRDNDSANMLEILIHSRTYDFSFSFGEGDSTLASATYHAAQDIATGKSFQTFFNRIDTVNRQLAKKYPAA